MAACKEEVAQMLEVVHNVMYDSLRNDMDNMYVDIYAECDGLTTGLNEDEKSEWVDKMNDLLILEVEKFKPKPTIEERIRGEVYKAIAKCISDPTVEDLSIDIVMLGELNKNNTLKDGMVKTIVREEIDKIVKKIEKPD